MWPSCRSNAYTKGSSLLPNKSGLWLDAVIKLPSNPELGDEPKALWEKMESAAALNRARI